MSKTTAAVLFSALSAVLLTACGEPQDTRPGQPVAHRRAAFKEIIKAFEPMGVMLRTDAYDAIRFKLLAGQVMALRNEPWGYFGPDTDYPPSHATPEVWKDAAKFAADKKAFFDATDKLASVAGTPDKKLAEEAYEAAAQTCKDCHKAFKKD